MKIILFSTNVYTGRVDFFYDEDGWARWKKRGLEHGDSGMVLVGITGEYLHFKSFGTIENPFNYMASVNLQHNEVWDGPLPTIDSIMAAQGAPSCLERVLSTAKIEFLNFKNDTND
jgi:hypothetical protein